MAHRDEFDNVIPLPGLGSVRADPVERVQGPIIHVPGVLAERRQVKDVQLTETEINVLRESARRLRWIGAVVTADVMQGIVARWEAE